MAKQKNSRMTITNVINKHTKNGKKEISQLTIKIDKRLDRALVTIANQINISRNRLIEDILYESGILEEVDENYMDEHH